MEHLLVLAAVLTIFVPALILPGPDFVAVIRSASTRGRGAGVATAAGVAVGIFIFAGLSMLGLSALLQQYQWLATAVRIVGGCYLIYLGVQLLREASASAVHDHAAEPAPAGHAFVMGLMVNLTNPKAVVLFASVFATAVTPATPIWVIGAMIALVSGLTFVWYTAVAVVIAAPAVLDRFAQGSNWIERIAGVCFIGFGGKVLADSRNPIGA